VSQSEKNKERLKQMQREHEAQVAKLKKEGSALVQGVYARHQETCREWDLK
jgi:hypothetical protein